MKTSIFQIFTLVTILLCGFTNAATAQKNTLAVKTVQQINATKAEVMDALKHYEQFPNWSPFLVTDPEQKYVIGGTNGELGSTFAWEGVAEKSQGVQTLAVINGNDYIRMDCEVVKPFKTNSIFEYTLVEKDGGVEVTQNFSSKMTGFSYFMARLFGAKKQIAEINELGLERLKNYVESNEAQAGL